MTLFSNDSTILEEVSIDYDENKVSTYDNYCDDTLQKKYTSVMIRVCHSRSLFWHACISMTNL